MKASVISLNVPTTDTDGTAKFYATLFGIEEAPSLTEEVDSHNMPVSPGGVWVTIAERQDEREPITAYVAVANLEASVAELEQAGGKVWSEPYDMPINEEDREYYLGTVKARGHKAEGDTSRLGVAQLMFDPAGNLIAVAQIEPHAYPFFKLGKFSKGESLGEEPDEQTKKEHKEAKQRGQKVKRERQGKTTGRKAGKGKVVAKDKPDKGKGKG